MTVLIAVILGQIRFGFAKHEKASERRCGW